MMLQAFKHGNTLKERRLWTHILVRALLIIGVLASLQFGGLAQFQCGRDANGSLCANNLCCSSAGYCGNTDAYCGSGCQSNCNSTGIPIPTDCDKDNPCVDSSLCCSTFGFCGTNESYCGIGACVAGPCFNAGSSGGLSTGAYVGIALGVLLGLIAVVSAALFVLRRNRKRARPSDDHEGGPATSALSFGPVRFSHESLKRATDGFSKELGRGAFGAVYMGTLTINDHDTRVAVKKLVDNERGLKDFEAEVKTLGSINHANLVALLGFCFESKQPFLVYEHVSYGSLDKWIFPREGSPDAKFHPLPWQTRVDIAKGTAKGLAYLHEDLQVGQAIIHLDIKPENILLDESFTPKVADFGMAKLLGSKKTQILASGGTFGYMAPEVYTGSATTRMDVYSFGMVLLELLSGRRHLDVSLPADRTYLPSFALRKLTQREELDVLDPMLLEGNEEGYGVDAEEARRIIVVAFLCLQRDPDERPDMSNVKRMIEGVEIPRELPVTLQSELDMTERLFRRGQTSSSTEKSILSSGNYSDFNSNARSTSSTYKSLLR